MKPRTILPWFRVPILRGAVPLLLFFLLSAGGQSALSMPASHAARSPREAIPAAARLNAGSMLDSQDDPGGSLDPGRWQAASGPEGSPHLAPQAAGDENWTAGFTLPGLDSRVYALAVEEDPDPPPDYRRVYVGGAFYTAGEAITNGIAKWIQGPLPSIPNDYWAPLNRSITGTVTALVFHPSGDVLYAGGWFTTAGGAATNIAEWDGLTWSPLGDGIGGNIYALAVDAGGWVYAGGDIFWAGGVSVNNIALWNGVSWLALSSGVNGRVYALAVDPGNGDLYVGGDFTTAGGVDANNIARWDGSSWSPVGGGTNGPVYALALYRSTSGIALYTGGRFTEAYDGVHGIVDAQNVAGWDGSSWSALGEPGSGTNGAVYALTLGHAEVGVLLAGGDFTSAGGVSANYIAVWDGINWSPLGSGMNDTVYALAVERFSNWVYAGGDFTVAGGVVASRIARWDGNSWSRLGTLGNGMSDAVSSLAMDSSGNFYAGGWFTTSGEEITNYIARWNGDSWSPVGGGMDGPVRSLAVHSNDDLYAGGHFTSAGGVSANNVARWDGSNWHALGSGITDGSLYTFVEALVVTGSMDLYAGGDFTTAGSKTVDNIAYWTGGGWLPLDAGTDDSVWALAVDSNNNLYAGGDFTSAGGVSANYIAKWDGSSWSPLGSGMGGGSVYATPVQALVVDSSGNLYAGGDFTSAGGVSANYIAKWDGSSWSPLGDGTNGPVNALAMDSRGALYAAVTDISEVSNISYYIAKWDGNTWTRLGGDLNGPALALLLDGDCDLYAGGSFGIAGDKVSVGIAHRYIAPPYDFQPPAGVDIGDVQAVASHWRDPTLYDPQYDVVPSPPDGVINILDIMAVAAHLGETCP